jgi:hypothetical protein
MKNGQFCLLCALLFAAPHVPSASAFFYALILLMLAVLFGRNS